MFLIGSHFLAQLNVDIIQRIIELLLFQRVKSIFLKAKVVLSSKGLFCLDYIWSCIY